MSKKVGRPTKYNPKFCDEMVPWFLNKVEKGEFPFLSKFARDIMNVCCDTAIEYTKIYPDFSEVYKKAKDIQKEFLITQTLNGKYNPTFAIFVATNLTDMKNNQRFEHVGNNGGPIKTKIDLSQFTKKELEELDKIGDKIEKNKDGSY